MQFINEDRVADGKFVTRKLLMKSMSDDQVADGNSSSRTELLMANPSMRINGESSMRRVGDWKFMSNELAPLDMRCVAMMLFVPMRLNHQREISTPNTHLSLQVQIRGQNHPFYGGRG